MKKGEEWTIDSITLAHRTCTESVFTNNSTIITPNARSFFDADTMQLFEKKTITINFQNSKYEAIIKCLRPSSPITRMSWRKNLQNAINEKYPNVVKTQVFPIIFFKKLTKDTYEIYFKNELTTETYSLGSEYDIDLTSAIKDKEGKIIGYYTTKYERSPENRTIAIEKHGLTCMACGLNFEKMYGTIGKDFIEVHHIVPLYIQKQEKTLDAENDLVCLCSNCHRMIHRLISERGEASVDDLKDIINHQRCN